MPRASNPAPSTETAPADPVGRFEDAMNELDRIVQSLERGELKLEESLGLYERGMQLAQQCREALQQAELKVQTLAPRGDGADPDS